ncbi:MAG TPA: homogentisate 1,2-dioxygenase [Baekduia sp.]|uniref:homogentisate 1,2-dioxygenase n=1 Tax=Baekduia sp. TaxID=2600305 RepID=UPI002D782E70|nr:homogentisate 1,2-dioxygenase [Baekduia sp.]HET6509010.1 homogentisate 1,2-dioxygenase [Baekduia sp.]
MASVLRRGHVPHPPSGMSEFLDEVYTVKGFYGPWASLYRRRNTAHPVAVSDPALLFQGLALGALAPSDATDPAGEPLTLMEGPDAAIKISGRTLAPPFAERHVERHQIRFYHQGEYRLETEFGPFDVGPGDFVVIPAGIIYRETPVTEGAPGTILIFEMDQPVHLAEELWDKVGFAGFYREYSQMELPEPPDRGVGEPTRVRLRYDERWHWFDYDFDPCSDVVGWLGDPVVYKLNVWDMPAIGTADGFLTPPSNAVLWGEDYNWFFNVLGPPAFPSSPPPKGSMGAPAHLNDYDEVWFQHASEFMPESAGDLWSLPRTVPHPGLKREVAFPPNPPRRINEMKLNFDTKSKLYWTDAAKAAWFPDPHVQLYTSLYGTHVGMVPDEAKAVRKH